MENYQGIKGLTFEENFITKEEHDSLIVEIDKKEWRTELKRRTQHYGYIYDYKTKSINKSMFLGNLPEFVKPITDRLMERNLFKKMPDQMIVNEYQRGQGIAGHIDCIPCFNSQIATVSLGWAYEMDFTHVQFKKEVSMMLPVCSILVLNEESRYRWLHRIKARKEDNGVLRERRISLTFRNVVLE